MEKEPTNSAVLKAVEQIVAVSQQEILESIQQVRTDVREDVSGAIHGVRGELLEVIQGTRDDLLKVIQSTRHELSHAIQESQKEVIEAMQLFASDVDGRFHRIENRLDKVEATMVTKTYLDDKFADEGSRYGLLIRETNDKTHRLVDALAIEGSLSPHAAGDITRSKPFGRK